MAAFASVQKCKQIFEGLYFGNFWNNYAQFFCGLLKVENISILEIVLFHKGSVELYTYASLFFLLQVLAIKFVILMIEFITLMIEFVTLVPLAQEFVIVKLY